MHLPDCLIFVECEKYSEIHRFLLDTGAWNREPTTAALNSSKVLAGRILSHLKANFVFKFKKIVKKEATNWPEIEHTSVNF